MKKYSDKFWKFWNVLFGSASLIGGIILFIFFAINQQPFTFFLGLQLTVLGIVVLIKKPFRLNQDTSE